MNRIPDTAHEPSEDGATERAVLPWFVLLGALLLYFLRFGYDFGSSDQDEVIPYLLHRLDASLFTRDWFVQTQVAEFSIRSYFVRLLQVPSMLMPVWLATLLVYIATWLATAGAVFVLNFHFTRDRLAASLCVLLALVLTPMWTLGGNELVHSMLAPSMLAWALGLWAVYHFFHNRYLLVPVLLGIACWMQPLVALQLALLLILYRISRLFDRGDKRHTVSGILLFGLLFALWSSPSLGPLVYQLFAGPDVPADMTPSLFYIIAKFRLPHHYLPGSFPASSVIRFGMLAILATAALIWLRSRQQLGERGFSVRMLAIIAGFCALALIFTEVIPVLVVARLQLFQMTVFAKLIFIIVLSGWIAYVLPTRVRRPFDLMLQYDRCGLAAVLVLLVLVWIGVQRGNDFLRGKIGPFVRAETPMGQLELWAKRETPHNSVFAIPPSVSSFRSTAQRTIVINFKAVPVQDHEMIPWFTRLLDMAPIDLPVRGGAAVMPLLDRAFEEQPAESLLVLSRAYRFDHVVRQAPLDGDDSTFEQIFEIAPWKVYRLRPMEPAAEPAREEPGLEGSAGPASESGAAREGAPVDEPEAGAAVDEPETGARVDEPETRAAVDEPETGAAVDEPEAGAARDAPSNGPVDP